MMKPRRLLRAFVPCLLLCAAPLLSHCGGDVQLATETGNPPVLEQKKLYLEVVADRLRVVGTAGAIAPPGAAVRVTNLTTGASVETTAASDGSLDVRIAGDSGDELELTVTSGAKQTSERISFAAIGSRTDLDGVSCDALEVTLVQTLLDSIDEADAECATNVDCAPVSLSASPCFRGCGTYNLSRDGAASFNASAADRTQGVCAALDACEREPPPPCTPSVPFVPACRAGRCEGVDPSTLTCNELLGAAEERRRQLRTAANKVCSVDADCTLLNVGVRCLGDCGRPFESVARGAADALAASVRDEVDSTYCGYAIASTCSEPDCGIPPDPAEAYCDAGTCAVRYLE